MMTEYHNIYHDSRCVALNNAIVDESVDPIGVPFWFLKNITQDFSGNQLIASGGFGSVYKAALRNGMVVIKKLRNDGIEVQEKNFRSEVDCLIDVKHKNIVRFLGFCYETQHVRKLYQGRYAWGDEQHMLFCFEFISGGSLTKYLTGPSCGLEWGCRYQIIKGVCEGVSHLHQQHRITHMDLKPDNILLDDNMVPKIADFGLSRRFGIDQSRILTEHIVGSRGYMAPEFVEGGTITFKADIYSLGIIIMEILMGCKEKCPNVDKVLESWMNTFGTSKRDHLIEQVKLCAEMGIECMHDDPGRRPDIQDIIRRLNVTEISQQVYFQDIEAIDVHSTQPWILVGHGKCLSIWDCEVKKVRHGVTDRYGMYVGSSVTSVRFIPRKKWCVAGDDWGYIHVYTCPAMGGKKSFETTGRGSVNSLAIHPTCPYLISACRYGMVEIWDWEKDWACYGKFQTGKNIVHATFNPMDGNSFVTSHVLDGLIKVWSVDPSAHQPIKTIECPGYLSHHHGHVFTEAAGRNHVVVSDNEYRHTHIWDLQTGARVHTFNGSPCRFPSAACCHPTLPLIAVCGPVDLSYDGVYCANSTVCFWNSTNYRLEKTVWCTSNEMIIYLGFVDSKRLVIGTWSKIEVLEIDMESLACQQ